MMMAVATAAPMLRAAPPIITTAAIAASAARGILHASAEIVADLSFPRLLFLRRLVLSRNCRVAFGRNRFRLVIVFMLVIELGGRSNHAFGFGVGFFFFKLVLFRFGSGGHCFALFFAFDGVVYRASGFIGGGKASFLRVALGFFFASLGDVLSQDRGFFRTQLGRSVLFVRGFGSMKFGLVVLDRKLGLRCSLLMRQRGSCGFGVLLDGSFAMLPLRKRLAGQRFEARRKRSRRLRTRLGMKFAPRLKCARNRRFVDWFGGFDHGSHSRRARHEIRGFAGSGDSRCIFG